MPRLYHLNFYTPLRRELRNNPTQAEKLLWQYLRRRNFHNLKFRRQEGIGRYIVDFYCPSKRVVIEIDGSAHNSSSQQAYDRVREEFLASCYIRVIRFSNTEVIHSTDKVLKELRKFCFTPTP